MCSSDLICLVVMVAILYVLYRLVHSRFGRVIEASRENETRMEAIGFPTYKYKLICFVIAGAIAGLSGAMIANQNSFVSPNLMFWVQSGNLMIMVILGGVGYHYGGLIGAVISAEGEHQALTQDALGTLAQSEIARRLGPLPDLQWLRVIAEKRATFACTPGLQRPSHKTPLERFWLAGDYTASDYPATIESAVRSGIACAHGIAGV